MRNAPRASLLRQLEAAVRKGTAHEEIRWKLRRCGMTEAEIWDSMLRIRRAVREERQ